MDIEEEQKGCVAIVVVAVVVLVCAGFSFGELRWLLAGHRVEATIDEIRIVERQGRRSTYVVTDLGYSFTTPDGERHHERHDIPGAWDGPAVGETAPALWRAGDPPPSRLVSERRLLPVIVFLVALVFGFAAAVRIWRQAGADVARSRRG